jgi:Cu(I)/Ag(I) efflux system membrane fusion protein
MSRVRSAVILAIGMGIGAASGHWYARSPGPFFASGAMPEKARAADRKIIYYRDPSGAPFWSATPKRDPQGRDYLPVYEDEEISFDPKQPKPAEAKASQGERKILYYRNPMGLPDTSPVPKKDGMGMDYIPVYEDVEQDDGKIVKVSLDKIQRTGVRTEPVQSRVIVRSVRAVGTVEHDESRQTIVTLRADGYIEDLFVNKTGQHVRAGEPLFRVYSPEIQRAQVDLNISVGAAQRGALRSDSDRTREIAGAMQRLRNLGVPESRIKEVRETGDNPRTLDWPSPVTGDVVEKRIVNGQRALAGDPLYRIVDHSHMWVIADVAESDIAAITIGTHATITFRAYASEPIEGTVTFIYPEMKAQTRTIRVRIEVANSDGKLKPDMYADVVFHAGTDERPVTAVPTSAVVDSGTRQVVLVAKGGGRFEPRPVRLGRRGDGYVEVIEGVSAGEEVVTTATFLIDAESNLRTALQAFTQSEAPK